MNCTLLITIVHHSDDPDIVQWSLEIDAADLHTIKASLNAIAHPDNPTDTIKSTTLYSPSLPGLPATPAPNRPEIHPQQRRKR